MSEPDKLRELLSTLWTPDWICPNCGRPFNDKTQTHTCGPHTVRQYLTRRPTGAVKLYRRFAQLVRELGPVIIVPSKSDVLFQTRLTFAAVDRLTDAGLHGHVVLRRRLDHERFTKIEEVSALELVHHFVMRSVDELDDEVRAWLSEAYTAASDNAGAAPSPLAKPEAEE